MVHLLRQKAYVIKGASRDSFRFRQELIGARLAAVMWPVPRFLQSARLGASAMKARASDMCEGCLPSE